jgi:phage shock protein PspC (stress-responsive transcriptional regulator)
MVKVEVVMDEKTLRARHIQNLKLVKLSWALFFILVGGSWILESIRWIDSRQEWTLIFAGSGAILLLLNVLRIFWKINISKFTTGLGVLGLLLGIARYYTLDVSVLPLLVLVTGIFLLLEALRK